VSAVKFQGIFLTFFLLICALENEYNLNAVDRDDNFFNITIGYGTIIKKLSCFQKTASLRDARKKKPQDSIFPNTFDSS